jgi:hypothetical protein
MKDISGFDFKKRHRCWMPIMTNGCEKPSQQALEMHMASKT